MADRDQPFLRRWSRRKRQGSATPVVETEPTDLSAVEMAAVKPEEAVPATTDDATADDATADLPDVETLDKDSDYTAFLRDGVPEQLRRRALRMLWRSDPAFAFRDGLNDYDEDFALAFTDAVTKTVKTAYKVGKGFVDDDDEKDAEEIEEIEEIETGGDVPVAADDRKDGSKPADSEAAKTDGADEADEEMPT